MGRAIGLSLVALFLTATVFSALLLATHNAFSKHNLILTSFNSRHYKVKFALMGANLGS